uniref:Putative serine protease 64 isoform C n=2 Tax=Reticulitermes speratus TaxID=60591 RepID=A0A1V1FIV0_9NEOP
MKAFTALLFLAAFSFLAQAKPKSLRPLNIAVPAVPQNTTEEWHPNMAARIPGPKYFPVFKNDTKSEPDHRITNGEPAKRGQFPWQVAIISDLSYFCGGSLISDTWVLTAAHCTYNRTKFVVILGIVSLTEPESQIVVQETVNNIVHSGYNDTNANNDIALIRLPVPVDFSLYISSVRLPSRSQLTTDFVGQTVRISGWGRVSDLIQDLSNTLQYADMPVIANSQCIETFHELITSTKICVSTDDKRSPCNGDSGGPLVIQEDDGRYTEIGIASFVHVYGCESRFPAVFTRVTGFLDWIEKNTGIVIV